MIKISKRNLYRYELENVIKENDCQTPGDVLDILFGTYEEGYYSEYLVKDRYYEAPKTTFMNRINTLWVYPLFVIIMPFRYVLFGDSHVDEDSKFGWILTWLIGDLK